MKTQQIIHRRIYPLFPSKSYHLFETKIFVDVFFRKMSLVKNDLLNSGFAKNLRKNSC